MKSWLLILLMNTGITSCHKDATVPDELLYRKWRITQIQYKTGNPVTASSTDQGAIVTFRPNGMILYGDDGKYWACCSPARFNRKGNKLDLVDVASVPMPERAPNDRCALVDCAPYGSAWQIETLTDTKLIITQTYATVTYQPYP